MRSWLVAAAVLGTAVALAVVDTDGGLGTWIQLRGEAAEAASRVQALEDEVARLAVEVAALKSDPGATERAIREDLELVQPGEWVVRFAPERESSPWFQ